MRRLVLGEGGDAPLHVVQVRGVRLLPAARERHARVRERGRRQGGVRRVRGRRVPAVGRGLGRGRPSQCKAVATRRRRRARRSASRRPPAAEAARRLLRGERAREVLQRGGQVATARRPARRRRRRRRPRRLDVDVGPGGGAYLVRGRRLIDSATGAAYGVNATSTTCLRRHGAARTRAAGDPSSSVFWHGDACACCANDAARGCDAAAPLRGLSSSPPRSRPPPAQVLCAVVPRALRRVRTVTAAASG